MRDGPVSGPGGLCVGPSAAQGQECAGGEHDSQDHTERNPGALPPQDTTGRRRRCLEFRTHGLGSVAAPGTGERQ
jgi:hypothetical protein